MSCCPARLYNNPERTKVAERITALGQSGGGDRSANPEASETACGDGAG